MGMLGYGLSQLRALGSPHIGLGKAKSVILIFNGGAPSHIDLWDPKPDAPSEVRGEFKTIKTSVPGTHITELLPQMAKRMHKLALIRSVHHGHSSHNGGMHWATVGRPYRVDSTLINPSPTDLPGVGTLCGWLAQRERVIRLLARLAGIHPALVHGRGLGQQRRLGRQQREHRRRRSVAPRRRS